MNSSRRLIFISVFGFLGISAGLLVTHLVRSNRPTAGLDIYTVPPSSVYIDGQFVGSTPFKQKFPPGEVFIRLVPDSSSLSADFQTKIRLTDGAYTLVRREFGASEALTAGDSATLFPEPGRSSSLSVVSDPDSAAVLIDNQPQGFTPLNVDSVTPGFHQVDISAPGYSSRSINIKVQSGFKSQIIVKLAADGSQTAPILPGRLESAASPTPIPAAVKILSTPTGFLRVRSGPGLNSAEIARLKPGDEVPLLQSLPNWYEIGLDSTATSSGWISSEYASLIR